MCSSTHRACPTTSTTLDAKVRAGTASPEERAAWQPEFLKRHYPELAASIVAAQEEERTLTPEMVAERVKRAERMARAAQLREARRPTIQSYARELRLQALVLQIPSRHPIRSEGSRCVSGGPGRPRRVRTARRARAPDRSRSTDDDPADPLAPRVVYALDAAGIVRRGPYHLRHTFATEALAAGVSIFELSRLMGARARRSTAPTAPRARLRGRDPRTAGGERRTFWRLLASDGGELRRRIELQLACDWRYERRERRDSNPRPPA